jgi:O-antigen ligase
VAMDTRTLAARAYPYLLVLTFGMTALAPPTLNAYIVMSGALLVGGTLCLMGVSGRIRPIDKAAALAVGVAIAAAAWFALATLWAAEPKVSLFAPTGAATWTVVATWLCAGVLVADSRTLRETIATTTATGVFFAFAVVFEAASRGLERHSGYAAGFFENSTSAGEVFAVAILAAVTGALISRAPKWRYAYLLSTLLCGIGIALSSSRTAALGLVLAGTFAVCVALLPRTRTYAWALVATPPALALVLTVLAVTMSNGVFGASAQGLVSVAGTGRDVIWRSAWAQLGQAPLFGKGLAQFEAFIRWGGLASGRPTWYLTADPHNTLLAAAIGGGVIGLLLVLTGCSAMLFELTSIARKGTRRWGTSMLASLPVLVLGMGLVGWVAAAPLVAAAALVGATLGAASPTVDPRRRLAPEARPIRAAGITAGVAALMLGFAFIQPLTVGYAFMRSLEPGAALSSDVAMALYERFPLPAVADGALSALLPKLRAGSVTDKERAREIIENIGPAMTRSVTLALRAMAVAQVMSAASPDGFPFFEKAALAGAEADPASGFWYGFMAVEAERVGLDKTAATYADKALRLPQDDDMRVRLEGLRTP